MRSPVTLRRAEDTDAAALVDLWSMVMRKADREDLVADVRRIVAECRDPGDGCIVVAEYDGEVAGAVYLRATTITPVNLEPVVQAIHPHVAPRFQGRGVGRALMEGAVTYAEERGIAHVATAATAGSRDANRFFARLALGPMATLRLAPTNVVRAKLSVGSRHSVGVRPSRQLAQILAARRSLRGSRESAPEAAS
jgi:GNAT superfamily N-acetyltransferase